MIFAKRLEVVIQLPRENSPVSTCGKNLRVGVAAVGAFDVVWEWKETDKAKLFDELKIFLTGERPQVSYAELAQKLSMSEAALKMTVSRMRRRYGELLRAEIANTVSTSEQVNDELQALFAALS